MFMHSLSLAQAILQFSLALLKMTFWNKLIWTLLYFGNYPQDIVAHQWCYEDPHCGVSHWEGLCQTGTSQSPIDLIPPGGSPETKALSLSEAYCREIQGFYAVNNGHTVEIRHDEKYKSPSLTIGGDAFDGNKYMFAQLHAHWGSDDKKGSEHTVNGQSYSLEMHLVHFKKEFLTLPDAIHTDGPHNLAVMGILFQVDDNAGDNNSLKPIIEVLHCVNQTDGTFTYKKKSINLCQLFPKNMEIFRYSGSLTAPGCEETVLWSVFKDPVQISRKQMNDFRGLVASINDEHHTLGNNYRPVQDLNGRDVKLIKLTRS